MRRVASALFGFPECRKGAFALARKLHVPYGEVSLRCFPDGESLVRLPFVAKRSILYRSLEHPNPKIVELVLALSALRDHGATHITLVAPYVPYMRQDRVFRAGEALSQKVLGRMLAPLCDAVVAVEPHLHRTRTLEEVFPGCKGVNVSGAGALARCLKKRGIPLNACVLGPDAESFRVARPLAEKLSLPWATAVKKRRGDRTVSLRLPSQINVHDLHVIIADDVISTGATVIQAAMAIKRAGALSFEIAVVHALHNQKTSQAIRRAGVRSLLSCDGVPHPTNKASLTEDLALAIKGLW